MDRIPTDKLREADKLRQDIDEYLAGGGTIKKAEHGDSGLAGMFIDPMRLSYGEKSRQRGTRESLKTRKARK